MQRGSILETARRDTSGGMTAGAILVLLCAGVLGINWKFVYNFVAGPVPFTAALSAAPGAHEWVTASGTLVSTGATESLKVGLRALPLQTTVTTARYLAMPIEGRVVVVKVDTDFAGNFVSGRLKPLPAGLVDGASSAVVYPWYIDAGGGGGYRSHVNLFVLIAAPLLPIAIVITVLSARSRMNLERYAPIANLTRFGSPMQVVSSIESELAAVGPSAHVGPLWIGPNWVVGLTPTLLIRRLADIVAAASVTTPGKPGKPTTHAVRFWLAGEVLSDTVDMSEQEMRAVLTTLAAKVPRIVTDDGRVFAQRWSRDRAGCEREAKERRSLPRSA
jgi:hypothetical protein